MSWFFVALRKYAVFSGRARRKEYWFFTLFYFLVLLLLGVVSELAGPGAEDALIFLAGAFFLALFLPALAVTVRRLHDVGRSGWWILLGLVPLGDIVLLIFTLLPSQPGQNRYGGNPLED
jgi:uncharacterized membrane protein YhaH (DUF805 family)